MSVVVSNFYRFVPVAEESLAAVAETMTTKGEGFGLRGLFILATEGLNGTFSGSTESVTAFEAFLCELLNEPEISFKRSESAIHPFRKFVVKIRPEIVTTGVDCDAEEGSHSLSPEEWEELLSGEQPPVILDTRNDYEVSLGRFRGAIDLGLDSFSEFRDRVEETNLPRDRPILTYCTGGVRCEKAVPILQQMGFKEVYQLRGGILSYLEKFPHRRFEGECFVFDDRVALDQELRPTEQYEFCKVCGQPCLRTHVHCVAADRAADRGRSPNS